MQSRTALETKKPVKHITTIGHTLGYTHVAEIWRCEDNTYSYKIKTTEPDQTATRSLVAYNKMKYAIDAALQRLLQEVGQ